MLYITYDPELLRDGAGAQMLRIISAFLISKKYEIGYVHTPLQSIGNYGLSCLEEKKEDVDQTRRYNEWMEPLQQYSMIPSEPVTVINKKEIQHDELLSYRNQAKNTGASILLKVAFPIFTINHDPTLLDYCKELPFSSASSIKSSRTSLTPIKIGVHIRRGDILLIERHIRYLPNEYYITIMRSLRNIIRHEQQITAPIEFHIYTEQLTKTTHFTRDYRSDFSQIDTILEPESFSDFLEFDTNGSSVVWHINTDPVESFIELSQQYDFLVISISAFSYLAAMISKQALVVYPPRSHHPPCSTWILHDGIDQHRERIIKHCVPSVITYCSGGALGDFIHQLGIIKEKYAKTGKKGRLYISHTARPSDLFPFGLEQAYEDTKELVSSQEYIDSYHIHRGETCDINLSSWVHQPILFRTNWRNIFRQEYGVEWCTSPYLRLPIVYTFKNKILISSSIKRFNSAIPYKELLKYLPQKPIFVASAACEWEHFSSRTGITSDEIDYVFFDRLYDLHCAIYSCSLFIGNLSSPLTIAQASFKPRICILESKIPSGDNVHMSGLDATWAPHCLYIYQADDIKRIPTFLYTNRIS